VGSNSYLACAVTCVSHLSSHKTLCPPNLAVRVSHVASPPATSSAPETEWARLSRHKCGRGMAP